MDNLEKVVEAAKTEGPAASGPRTDLFAHLREQEEVVPSHLPSPAVSLPISVD